MFRCLHVRSDFTARDRSVAGDQVKKRFFGREFRTIPRPRSFGLFVYRRVFLFFTGDRSVLLRSRTVESAKKFKKFLFVSEMKKKKTCRSTTIAKWSRIFRTLFRRFVRAPLKRSRSKLKRTIFLDFFADDLKYKKRKKKKKMGTRTGS